MEHIVNELPLLSFSYYWRLWHLFEVLKLQVTSEEKVWALVASVSANGANPIAIWECNEILVSLTAIGLAVAKSRVSLIRSWSSVSVKTGISTSCLATLRGRPSPAVNWPGDSGRESGWQSRPHVSNANTTCLYRRYQGTITLAAASGVLSCDRLLSPLSACCTLKTKPPATVTAKQCSVTKSFSRPAKSMNWNEACNK